MPYKNKEQLREYLRAYHVERRDFVRSMKEVPCADCGIEYPHYMMDFDHLGSKSYNISEKQENRSVESLLQEMAKCDVVCSNCHRRRTWERGEMANARGLNPLA